MKPIHDKNDWGKEMKKKIAVFANGWNNEYLMLSMEGIQKCAAERNADIFLFVDYAAYTDSKEVIIGQTNILNLPHLQDFDGVILLGNMLTVAGEVVTLREEILKYNVPSVCLDYDLEGVDSLLTESATGMRELVEHMIEVHDAREFLWLGGPKENRDSHERFDVLVTVLEEHGLTLQEDNILYGDWSYYSSEWRLSEWMETHGHLPDVVVCANDNMAVGTAIFFQERGIEVPGQIRVTGFDHLESAQVFYPAITSVERNVAKHSYKGTKRLLDKLDGIPCEEKVTFRTHVALEESCGCQLDEVHSKQRLLSFQNSYKKSIDSVVFSWHLTSLDKSMVWVQKREELYQALVHVWDKSHENEGDNFSLCLDDLFIRALDGDCELRTHGYGEQVKVVYSMKDGVSQLPFYINSRDVVPFYDGNTLESHTYLIVPLHIEDKCVGYMTMRDTLALLPESTLLTWTKHLTNGLERARQNILMDKLNYQLKVFSQTDKLTGLLNREGYEKTAIPQLEKCRQEGLSGAMMIADLNHMKQINDEYGHLQGDVALITVAKSIKETLPENWNAIRYGGDEFVMLGECPTEELLEELKRNLIQRVKENSEDILPYELTVSVGYVMVEPYLTLSIEEYFRRADQAMYLMKEQTRTECNL